ncbi:MAG: CDP-alcohol phosphatidyltransferase family protein [Oscillospiraceae bacterium]|jgi:CDP-diacylglycerol--serine O-phosphatidyltransferase|nr:CDP-alcohol phosphatidyltransferase family protein [Oscillospiraceae bacterium]
MIGFYNYSVFMTYIGLIASVVGISFVISGAFTPAFICLLISGFCDMFDGRIARIKKNRSDLEKSFGIQIDSLCDVICFGVFPAIIGFCLGGTYPLRIISSCMIVLCAVIRLGYFNVMEIKRQSESEGKRDFYTGLPVTSVALVLPLAYIAKDRLDDYFPLFFQCLLILISLLFLMKIKVHKPGIIGAVIMSVLGIIIGLDFLFRS